MIVLDGVCKKYGQKTALDNVSLRVKRGSLFALLGPNGAGKSTLVRLITTLMKADRGFISVAGHDVERHPCAVRGLIGVVFQSPSLDDDLTVLENLQLHAAMYSMQSLQAAQRIQHLLGLMDLQGHRKALARKLSGGLKRRLEIARALLHRPKVVFLDEPSIGLDTQSRLTMWRQLQELRATENLTVVFTTHHMEEAEAFAEHVAIIDHGTIIATGSISQLKQSSASLTLQEAYLKLTGYRSPEAA